MFVFIVVKECLFYGEYNQDVLAVFKTRLQAKRYIDSLDELSVFFSYSIIQKKVR